MRDEKSLLFVIQA